MTTYGPYCPLWVPYYTLLGPDRPLNLYSTLTFLFIVIVLWNLDPCMLTTVWYWPPNKHGRIPLSIVESSVKPHLLRPILLPFTLPFPLWPPRTKLNYANWFLWNDPAPIHINFFLLTPTPTEIPLTQALKTKRTSLYPQNSSDEVHSKFGRELDECVKNSKIQNLRCGFGGQLFLRVAQKLPETPRMLWSTCSN